METVNGIDYLTPKEAAERKGVALASIYKAIERGALTTTKIMGRIALAAPVVDAYEPGSYGEAKRAYKKRGPGRPSSSPAAD